jgi:hypothetical protein
MGTLCLQRRLLAERQVHPTESIDCEELSVENAISIDPPCAANEKTLPPTVVNLLCKTKAVNDSSEAGDVVTGWDTVWIICVI